MKALQALKKFCKSGVRIKFVEGKINEIEEGEIRKHFPDNLYRTDNEELKLFLSTFVAQPGNIVSPCHIREMTGDSK